MVLSFETPARVTAQGGDTPHSWVKGRQLPYLWGKSLPGTLSTHYRWLLFEEKLEIGAGRWSAPHVPTLALPSLQKLRSLLAEGIVLLDCQAQSLLELVGRLGKAFHLPGNFSQSLRSSQSLSPPLSYSRDCPFLSQR